jgi:hypothetical protein
MHTRHFCLPVIASALLLSACASGPPAPGTPEFAALKHDTDVAQTKTAAVEAPEWFVNPPKDSGFVYAAGSASSSDLQFSLDKAILNAKYQLADQVNGKLSGKQKDFISENGGHALGTSERATSNVIADVALPGYQVVNRKVVPLETQYRSYVLLKFAVMRTDAPQAAAADQASAQRQAKAAFDDLEAELVTVKEPPPPMPLALPAAPAPIAPPAAPPPLAMKPQPNPEPPPPTAAPRPSVTQDSLL